MMEKDVMNVPVMDKSAISRRRLNTMLFKIMSCGNIGWAEGAPGRMNSIHRLDADAVIPEMRVPSGIRMSVLMIRAHHLLD